MNCQKFESIASELARGQMMEAEIRTEALSHSGECSRCAARMHQEQILTRGLIALASETSAMEVPTSIEASLLSAFRNQSHNVPSLPARSYQRYWLTAIAAMLLIVFSVVAVRWRENRVQTSDRSIAQRDQPKDQTVAKATPETPPEVKPVKDDIRHRMPIKRKFANVTQARESKRSGNDNNVLANHASSEVATEFIPLGYLNAAAIQDGGQIVRVELPRTALASFGLPVNMDRYNERVKADILLGVDGMAHAIRFVQDKREQ